MALQPRYEFSASRERPPVQGEEEIAKLRDGPERRFIALGKHYKAMDLDDAQLREVEDELRRARMYEVLTLTSSMRQLELDEQRRRLAEEQQREQQRQQDRAVSAQVLRQRALAALQHEAEALRAVREEQLAADRRAVVEREKERLMERRKAFEADHIDAGDASRRRGSTPGRHGGAAPVLVMTVALGDGKEDQLTVRQNDDPQRVAITFARKHRLPEHAVHTLKQQIQANLQASATRHSTPGASRSPAASEGRALFHGGAASTPRTGRR